MNELEATWGKVVASLRRLSPLLPLTVLAVGIWLRTGASVRVNGRSPDERVYTHYAQTIAAHGLDSYRDLFAHYAADPSTWLYPSPSRISHVLAFAGVMKLTGGNGEQAGAAASWVFSLCSTALTYWLGRRFFNRWVGLSAALFLATYTPDIEFARRAWGESAVCLFSLVLFGLTLEVAREPRRWLAYAGFFAAGITCSLTKETGGFAYAACTLWLLAVLVLRHRDRLAAAVLITGTAASVAGCFGLLCALAGSGHLAWVAWATSSGIGSNDWGAQYASGPWHQYFQLLWLLAPLTLLLAGVGAWVIAAAPRWRDDMGQQLEPGWVLHGSLALVLSFGFIAVSCFGPNLQYMRIMAPANPSYCLLAGLGVTYLLVRAPLLLRGLAYPLAVAALPVLFVVSSWRSFSLYSDVVVETGMQDLAARWLLDGAAHRGDPAVNSSRQALEPPLGEDDLSRSVRYCQNAEYQACVTASLSALRQRPNQAEAWNNAAAGYAGLRRWDDAIRCATEAIRLAPDFQLAKNNLAWSVSERARSAGTENAQR